MIDGTITSAVPNELKFANETGLVEANDEVSVHKGFASKYYKINVFLILLYERLLFLIPFFLPTFVSLSLF